MKTLLKRILPKSLWKLLQSNKRQLYNAVSLLSRLLHTIRDGYAQPVVANDFCANYKLDDPHQYAFAFHYFAYRYRVRWFDSQILPLCWLRFLVKHKDIPQVADYSEKSGVFRKILRCSNIALLAIPEHVDQDTPIGSKDNIRRRKRCIEKGYTVRPIEYDEHFNDIYAINTSAAERCGKPIRKYYRQYPAKRSRKMAQLGIDFRTFGCFKDDTLVAYASLIRYGNFFIMDRFLGHKQHLQSGVTSLLFFRIVEILSNALQPGYYIHYDDMRESSLAAFKRRLGFISSNLLLPTPPGFIAAARKLSYEQLTGEWVDRYLETLDLQASLNYSPE